MAEKAITVENDHPCSFCKGEGWWWCQWWQRATDLENKHTCSSSRVEGGAGASGRKEHPRKRGRMLVSGEGWC